MSKPFVSNEYVGQSGAEIQAALEANGFCMLNSGVVYQIDKTIVLPGACTVHGNGAEIRCTGPSFPAFVARDVDRVRLNDLRITRPGFGTGDGIVVQNARQVILDGVVLTDHYNGIKLADCISPVPNVVNVGTPGSTAYAYAVVCVADGLAFEIDRPGATLTGNATLDDNNYNQIEWADLVVHATTVEYRVYRTAGGATQGLISHAIMAGAQKFCDKGIVASTAVPDSPRYSPMTISTRVGAQQGSTTRKYAVVAVIDGIRWANYDVVTNENGPANFDADNYITISWPRLHRVEGLVSEKYEVYRVLGGGTGLIGTVTETDHLDDIGLVATGSVPAIPVNTRNSKVTIENTTVRHRAASAANSQFHLQINSVDYLAIKNSHFGGGADGVGGAWLDGVKARARVYSVRWDGGSANHNGKSLSDGGSGDGADFFAGIYHLDLDGVEFVGNGGNGTTSKTIGWWQVGGLGNPEQGIPHCTRYRGIIASRNAGSGVQLEGVEDDTLGRGQDPLRGRVRNVLISDLFLENNSVFGLDCNAQGVHVSNTVIRANKQNNVKFRRQASSCTLDGVQLLGASSGALGPWRPSTPYSINDRVRNGLPNREYRCIKAGMSAASRGPTTAAADIVDNTVHWTYLGEAGPTYAQVLCEGTIVIKTLAADLAAHATSFTIPDATDVPLSGRVYFGRKVGANSPGSTYEAWNFTRVGTTITITDELPGETAPATFYAHNKSDGDNARDVGFGHGARKIKIVNCQFNGKELSSLAEVSLDGDMAGLLTVSRNNIEILDGADEIEIYDNQFRFVTSDPFCAPFVALLAADVRPSTGAFSARVTLRHADNYHQTPVSRYAGGIGSEYISLRYGSLGGNAGIGSIKYRKESKLANTTDGWVSQ